MSSRRLLHVEMEFLANDFRQRGAWRELAVDQEDSFEMRRHGAHPFDQLALIGVAAQARPAKRTSARSCMGSPKMGTSRSPFRILRPSVYSAWNPVKRTVLRGSSMLFRK